MTTLGAVRKLVAQMRRELAAGKGWNYAEYEKGRIVEKQRCLSLLEAALAQAPAVRVDDVLLRVSDEDLRWCKEIVGALQEAGGPTNNMRAVGLSRLIAALEAALAQQPAPLSAPVGVGLREAAAALLKAFDDSEHPFIAAGAAERVRTALAQQPASSAPLGVEAVEAALHNWLDWCNEHNEEPDARSGAKIALEALAQQPAACDMGALCIGCEPRNADGSCPGKHVAAKTGDSDNV